MGRCRHTVNNSGILLLSAFLCLSLERQLRSALMRDLLTWRCVPVCALPLFCGHHVFAAVPPGLATSDWGGASASYTWLGWKNRKGEERGMKRRGVVKTHQGPGAWVPGCREKPWWSGWEHCCVCFPRLLRDADLAENLACAKGITNIRLGAHVVLIGLAGTMRRGLLLFVLARLFAHLKVPHMVGITAMIVCLHCVVGAKLFSTSLPVSAFFLLVPPLQFHSWFVFCVFILMRPFKQAYHNRLLQWLHNGAIDFAINPFCVTNAICQSMRWTVSGINAGYKDCD